MIVYHTGSREVVLITFWDLCDNADGPLKEPHVWTISTKWRQRTSKYNMKIILFGQKAERMKVGK